MKIGNTKVNKNEKEFSKWILGFIEIARNKYTNWCI